MGFINGYLLPALGLISVPLILHFLFRRRFRRVDWAPMRYLKLTLRRNRRRLRLEQWLLLLVRMLVVALLVLTVVRPVFSGGGLPAWLAGDGRTARVLVLDDSLSMGFVSAGRSAFARATELADALTAEMGSQDSLTLVVASNPRQPVLRDARSEDRKDLQAAIRTLSVSEAGCSWAAVFAAVDDLLQETTFPQRQVTLVTDLRRPGWDADVTEVGARWAEQGIALQLVDVGSKESDNLAVVSLEPELPLLLNGARVRFVARIANGHGTATPSFQAVWNIDGRAQPALIPAIDPQAETELVLETVFDSPGQHVVSLSLPTDALPGDNQRWCVVDVRDHIDVLLVDGEPGSRPFEGETDFLAVALSAGDEPWNVERLSDTEWLAGTPGRPDLMVLANVATIPPKRGADLERMVKKGMGLFLFPGDLVDPASYRDALHRDGEGLLPAELGEVVDEPVEGMAVEAMRYSPLEPLGRLAPGALSRITARRYLALDEPADGQESTRVLARWNDSARRPAVLEKRFGRGRVLLWTTTADRQWSDWAIDPTYVLALREAALWSARPNLHRRNFVCGETFLFTAEGAHSPLNPRLTRPGSEEAIFVKVVHREGTPASVRFPLTATAGLCSLRWKDVDGALHAHLFAFNPDPREGDLERMQEGTLRELLGALEPEIVRREQGASVFSAKPREVWRNLAMLAMACMMLETMLAVWVGRRR